MKPKAPAKYRFQDSYEPTGDIANLNTNGLLPCAAEYELGTASLGRDENLLLLASNTTIDKSSLALELKWRPQLRSASPQQQQRQVSLVSMISKLTLAFDNDEHLYSFEQLETYSPSHAPASESHNGTQQTNQPRLNQYGSRGSKLKLIICAPYRRMRLVFRGPMEHRQRSKGSDQQVEQVFVRLSVVISSVSKIFDFKEEFSGKHAKSIAKQLQNNKLDSLLHDRHELLVRLIGECTIRPALAANRTGHTQTATVNRYNITQWGFYGRHFITSQPSAAAADSSGKSAKRVLALCDNGQAIHLGQFGAGETAIKFGYGSLGTRPITLPIEKSYEFDWSKQAQDLDAIKQVKIGSICCGFKKDFELVCEQRFVVFGSGAANANGSARCALFDAKLSGKNGFAWVLFGDNCELLENELDAIESSRRTYLDELEAGCVAPPVGAIEPQGESSCCGPLIVPIASDECRCSALVGSKAASLAQLVAFGARAELPAAERFEVPKGFALTRYAYDKLVAAHKPLRDAIERLDRFVASRADLDDASGGGGGGDDDVEAKWLQELPPECARVRETVANIDLEHTLPELVALLDTSVAQVFGSGSGGGDDATALCRVAVRSSSWGEDEADMSAAGQLDTKLDIECAREPLIKAILDCFASKFSFENIEYKRQHGLSVNMPMGVVVQEMVQCERAGVMFSCEPTSGDDRRILITANYGLGESVVSGQSEPDSIYVSRRRVGDSDKHDDDDADQEQLEVQQVVVGEKKVVTGSGVDESKLDKSKCCLDEDESLKLAKCAVRISKYFHSEPCDIEWGLTSSADGAPKVYLFQARPITGLDVFCERELMHECDRPSPAEVDFYTRANVGEVMPFASRPFTLTHLILNWSLIAYRMVMRIVSHKIPFVPYISSEVQYNAYHAFFNVRFSSFLPLSEEAEKEKSAMSKAIEISMFGHEIDPQPEIVEAARNVIKEANPFRSLRFLWSTGRLRFAPRKIVLRERPKVKELRRQVLDLKLADGYEKDKLRGLYNQLNALFRTLPSVWRNHIEILMISSGDNMILIALLAKYIKDSTKLFATFSRLVSNNRVGGGGAANSVVSAEIPRRFQEFAALIKQSGGADELQRFVDLDTRSALAYLRDATQRPKLAERFNEFMDKFGHRCYDEFEFAQKAWREQPEVVVDMVRRNCRSELVARRPAIESEPETESAVPPSSKRASDDDNNNNVDKILSEAADSTPLSVRDRLLIKHLLVPSCRSHVQMREHTKDILVDHADVMRLATRLLARALVREHRLPEPSLFYYLTIEECDALIGRSEPTIVMQALRRRHLFERKFIGKVWKFDEIIRSPDVLLRPLIEDEHNGDKGGGTGSGSAGAVECLFGTPASSGSVRARVSLVTDYSDLDRVRSGTILVTHSTDIAFSPIFPIVSGIVTEVGGLISHGAVVAREYGLPSVLGVRNVTRLLEDGELIELDADKGKIVRLRAANGGTPTG